MKQDLNNSAIIFRPANLLDLQFISGFLVCNTDIPISLFFICRTAFVVFLAFDLFLSFYIFFASLFTFLYIFM